MKKTDGGDFEGKGSTRKVYVTAPCHFPSSQMSGYTPYISSFMSVFRN